MTKTELIAIAQHHAGEDQLHNYTHVDGFVPHEWVIKAMQDAYDAGHTKATMAQRSPVAPEVDPRILKAFVAVATWAGSPRLNGELIAALGTLEGRL